MNRHIRHFLYLLTILISALSLQSCIPAYRMNGSFLNYDIYKTINVAEFPIRASLVYPPLQQTFENELLNSISRQTRLQEIDGPADIDISGAITGYSLSPQAVGTDAYATETRLTITVKVKYTDNKNPANNFERDFSAFRQFPASQMLTDVQDELCQEISKELVELIFNATLGNW